jgi:hypothetical protein
MTNISEHSPNNLVRALLRLDAKRTDSLELLLPKELTEQYNQDSWIKQR